MKHTFFVFVLMQVIVSCNRSHVFTTGEQKAVIDSARKMMDNYYSDIKTSGLMAEFKYLDSSADFFWVPPGYASALSYDSVAKVLRSSATLYKSIDNTFDTLRIIPLSKEFATYTARIHSTMTDTTGKTAQFTLAETGVLVKRKNGWKLFSGQTSVVSN